MWIGLLFFANYPSMSFLPGFQRPVKTRSMEVFPHPEGPMTSKRCPLITWKESKRTRSAPFGVVTVTFTMPTTAPPPLPLPPPATPSPPPPPPPSPSFPPSSANKTKAQKVRYRVQGTGYSVGGYFCFTTHNTHNTHRQCRRCRRCRRCRCMGCRGWCVGRMLRG
jgi:hypothetical protein